MARHTPDISDIPHLIHLIKARGFKLVSCNPSDQFLPGNRADSRIVDAFYRKLSRYSFRLFLRELLEHQDKIRVDTVSRYCSETAAQQYLDFLCQMNILSKEGHHYSLLVKPVANFGETLEWYVAEIFRREFGAEAIYRANLHKSLVGGDFDVLAHWAHRLVFVEVKSSPPRAVEAPHVRLFFSRMWELLPDLAIFLEDTQLRMADKIVPFFEEEIRRHYGWLGQEEYPVLRLEDELFHINHCIYIVNSKRGLIHNLRICLRDFLRHRQQLLGMP